MRRVLACTRAYPHTANHARGTILADPNIRKESIYTLSEQRQYATLALPAARKWWARRPGNRRSYETQDARYDWAESPRSAEWRECFYCGEPADTVDHCPPLSRTAGYEAFDLEHEYYLKVPACRECNGLLGDSLQVSIWERCQVAKSRIQAKYRKVLRTADFDAEDLIEMSAQMRREVKGWMREKATVERRLAYEVSVLWWLDQLEDRVA